MAPPTRITQSQVDIFLSYIHSAAPVPPLLFSRPSRQRHHFLNIDHNDPYDYLAWPAADSRIAVDRLLQYSPQHYQPIFSVAYSATDELDSFAHCHLRTIRADTASNTPDLRLVFHWNSSTNQWNFHNTALMPFPHGCSPSLSPPTTTTTEMSPFLQHDDFLKEPDAVHIEHAEDDNDDDNDAYWDAYDQSHDDADDGTAVSRIAANLNTENQTASEDAYWAQYAAVQGSADSTQPSPLPNKRNKSNHLPNDPFNPHIQPHSRNEPSSSSLSVLHSFSKQNQDFPSPHTLAERLNAISARPSASPLDDPESPESQSTDTITSTQLNAVSDSMSDSDSTSPSPPPGLVKLGVKSAGSPERRVPIDLSVVTASSPPFQNLPSSPDVASKERQFGPGDSATVLKPSDEATEALAESIRGVYRLWKAGRPSDMTKISEKDIFLDLVRQAIHDC